MMYTVMQLKTMQTRIDNKRCEQSKQVWNVSLSNCDKQILTVTALHVLKTQNATSL